MKILAIETSCDETSVAIVENGRRVLSNVIASQIDIHAKTGGVVPEIAARVHVLKMVTVLDSALDEAKCSWKDIDAIAVTRGPGLISSLIIGTEAASVISFLKEKILIPVQHITGHIYSNWLEAPEEPKFPILILTVSGGHNEIILMKDHFEFEVLGETRDDAAGEAFDKVARILEMGYPGGPAISKAAEKGNGKKFKLPIVLLEKDSLDFSFSGLKTAVLTIAKEYLKEGKNLDEQFQNDLAASFQETATEILAEKLFRAFNILLEKGIQVKEVHLAGGVSANKKLREKIQGKFSKETTFRYPRAIAYCTDNAAMIGAAAYYLFRKNPKQFKAKTNIVPTTEFQI